MLSRKPHSHLVGGGDPTCHPFFQDNYWCRHNSHRIYLKQLLHEEFEEGATNLDEAFWKFLDTNFNYEGISLTMSGSQGYLALTLERQEEKETTAVLHFQVLMILNFLTATNVAKAKGKAIRFVFTMPKIIHLVKLIKKI